MTRSIAYAYRRGDAWMIYNEYALRMPDHECTLFYVITLLRRLGVADPLKPTGLTATVDLARAGT